MARGAARRVRKSVRFFQPNAIVVDGSYQDAAAAGPEIDGCMAGSGHQRFAT
jgi:hypothetical protein